MKTGSILIITHSEEKPSLSVSNILNGIGEQVFRLNTDLITDDSFLLSLSHGFDGWIKHDGNLLNLSNVKSAWYRRPTFPLTFTKVAQNHQEFVKKQFQYFLWSLYTNINVFWVNHPLSIRLIEHNKLYQMRKAQKCGFAIPKTIITSDADELIKFARDCGGSIALKTIHPDIINFADGRQGFIYTNLVTIDELKSFREDISLSPIIAQSYVEKKLELRITVVGKKIFSCAIYSQNSARTKHDWRKYDFTNIKHEIFDLPELIQAELFSLMSELKIVYGAFDLILTPENEFVFLEVNPSGQWLWIEELTGLPISKAIANLLSNPY